MSVAGEDRRDLTVGVVLGEPADQLDRVLGIGPTFLVGPLAAIAILAAGVAARPALRD